MLSNITTLCYIFIYREIPWQERRYTTTRQRHTCFNVPKRNLWIKDLRGHLCEGFVRTGALYFFFQDKDDLFCEVVGNFMDRLNEILREHFSYEVNEMESGKATEHDDSSDFEAVAQIVHELYTYRDEVLLVLTKAQGSSMERMPDRLVDQMDAHNAFICEAMCKAYHVPMVEKSVVHWMSHSQIDMFIFMVTHIDDEKEALQFAEKGVKYLLAGWYGIIRP